jgi:O-antigen/teichoic acid export membrane protein
LNDLTIYAVYITLIGAAITVIINLVLVPSFGYLASAWAHIASYGAMLIMSFIFARNHFKINYNMKGLIPYFIVAVAMVLFSQLYHFKNLVTGLAVSTVLIVAFILFAQFKDKTITVFLGK